MRAPTKPSLRTSSPAKKVPAPSPTSSCLAPALPPWPSALEPHTRRRLVTVTTLMFLVVFLLEKPKDILRWYIFLSIFEAISFQHVLRLILCFQILDLQYVKRIFQERDVYRFVGYETHVCHEGGWMVVSLRCHNTVGPVGAIFCEHVCSWESEYDTWSMNFQHNNDPVGMG